MILAPDCLRLRSSVCRGVQVDKCIRAGDSTEPLQQAVQSAKNGTAPAVREDPGSKRGPRGAKDKPEQAPQPTAF